MLGHGPEQRFSMNPQLLEDYVIKTAIEMKQLRRERQYVRDVIFNALQERTPHALPAYTRTGIVGKKTS